MKKCCKENDDLISRGDVKCTWYWYWVQMTSQLISGTDINDITMRNIQSSDSTYDENLE